MNLVHKTIRTLTPLIPQKIRTVIRSRISLKDYDLTRRRAANPFLDMPEETYPESRCRFGIIEDMTQYHKHYIAACREMGVSYKVLDLLDNDWVDQFHDSECDAILVWPSCSSTTLKQTFDYRLRILEDDLGMNLYPTWRECWLTEHKPRLRDWMDSHRIPHPRTWVFHDRKEALDFANGAQMPIVVKTATGASASGIQIVKDRNVLKSVVHRAFGKGLCPRSFDPHDRQLGFIFLQEFLPDVEEWRMVRIGDSFFGHLKERGSTGLHSGSKLYSWLDPSRELLDLLKRVTDIGGFNSMDVDIFRSQDGKLFVNEFHTVFGCSVATVQMKVNDIEGRYLWTGDGWRFEAGDFCRNHMCNLRVQYLSKRLLAERTEG